MRITDDLSVDRLNESQIKLPSILNPRDVKMMETLNKKTPDKQSNLPNDASTVNL
jgi:hypothetical protein